MFRAVRQATLRSQRLGYRLRMKRLRRPYLAVDRIFPAAITAVDSPAARPQQASARLPDALTR